MKIKTDILSHIHKFTNENLENLYMVDGLFFFKADKEENRQHKTNSTTEYIHILEKR